MSVKDENDDANKVLALDMLHEMGGYAGGTSGTMLIARFCGAVNRGETPAFSDLKLIANAMEPLKTYYLNDKGTTDNRLRDALDEFARRMNLKKKQGRGGGESFGQIAPMVTSVTRYLKKVNELISDGCQKNEAKRTAIRWSAESEKITDKAMKNRIKKYLAYAEVEYKSEEIFSQHRK